MDKAMIVCFLIVLAALDDAAATTFNSLREPYHHHFLSKERTLTSMEDKRDVEVLLSFKKAITSDPSGSLSDWTAENSANVCSWEGVSCMDGTNRVTALSLFALSLEGTLSPTLGNLSFLSSLDLSSNNLSGRIPGELASLQKLETLYLYSNNLSGRIPRELGSVQNLTILDLSNNNFIGEIPSSMANLSTLRLLNLSRNHLEGKILASLSEISTLEQLDLSKNSLSGEIPQELSKLTMLAYLDVSFNRLCGRIPEGTQMDTFSVASFQRNKCLCGYPLQACNKATTKRGDGVSPNVSDDQGWLNRVDEHISLIALGLGYGLGFGGVVTVIIMWDKAWHWMVPPKIKPFYGMYQFPK